MAGEYAEENKAMAVDALDINRPLDMATATKASFVSGHISEAIRNLNTKQRSNMYVTAKNGPKLVSFGYVTSFVTHPDDKTFFRVNDHWFPADMCELVE